MKGRNAVFIQFPVQSYNARKYESIAGRNWKKLEEIGGKK
jgi:hypothetical protein